MKQAQQFVRGEDLSGGRKLNALVQETAMDPQFLAETMRSYRDVAPASTPSSWLSPRR